MPATVRRLDRAEIGQVFDDLARLRITVFRDYPYLYDGDMDYERRYLETFLASPGAVVIGAFDQDRLVGAATGSPLTDHHAEFAAPFRQAGLDVERVLYFGESVLEAAYRGQGVGVRFFEERERAARDGGYAETVFSAVVRPPDHPARPAGYEPLDAFWRNRGYSRIDGMATSFEWKDVGDDAQSAKTMEYWRKILE